ncbi:hypothetical protein [Hymenobacter properus]|uniref:Uncharacterized protein n=1 Tax=Hymenobacter properus TaxID=2791026 RepID=A0A931BCW6_9BACT|nr:hypothetical protein [Hymenobacter properus]MBF9141489.1 hypothetical protein [Hymenobacter properus]MBR7720298.1 hypothetical protein [Microvirga sp. SRT04]
MTSALRLSPLALLLLPLLGQAQTGATSSIGLELPAPAPPSRGHFLTGAYVVGTYSALPLSSSYGYGVQPFLRYQWGSGTSSRRPYVQYSFAPYRMPTYSAGQFAGTDAAARPANAGFAPLAFRQAPLGALPYGSYGGLGAFSVGIPMQIGRSSAVLNVTGTIVQGLLNPATWGVTGL